MNLRQLLRSKRRALSASERSRKSAAIARNLALLLPFRRASHIAFYMPTPEEVDTLPAIELASNEGKDIYLPVIDQALSRKSPLSFEAFEPEQTQLVKNRYGILEPAHRSGTPVRAIELDVICVPLVGFNQRCDRIGMGAGYYDRSLASPTYRRTTLVGVAFDCQQADFEPAAHDVPMDVIVTESQTYSRR